MKDIIQSLNEIGKVYVHWSESEFINKVLGSDDSGDINKMVDTEVMDQLIATAGAKVELGYDKTVLTVFLSNGDRLAVEHRFYISEKEAGLLSLINKP
jgi:hypothetical protein